MDYKEKLRLAKEALDSGSYDKKTIEYIFPELKESKNKRVRIKLIEFFKGYSPDKEWWGNITQGDILAWFEKQGVKPTNNVEPKFKVGEWIINAQGTLRHIINVDKGGYQTDGGWLTHDTYEKTFHLWTIQDAKDGDVVADKSDGAIGIFQSIGHHPDGGSYNDPSYCFLHCHYDDGFFYADFEDGNTIDSDSLVPATKEQRDLLFQKMKDAGYKWDAEKKELKKISQEYPLTPDDCIKSSWGEEDELHIKELESLVKQVWANAEGKDDKVTIHKMSDLLFFLKTLKPQLKQEWSEEDESWFDEIWRCISKEYPLANSFIFQWFKSLKDRYTWKPSDEQMLALNIAIEMEDGDILKSLYQDLLKLKE